jgi:hypothetical protein
MARSRTSSPTRTATARWPTWGSRSSRCQTRMSS